MKIYEMTVSDDVDINFHKTKSLDDFVPIAETDKDLDIMQVIKLGDNTYSVWTKRTDNSYAFVEKVDLSNSEDELYSEDEIICPHCKESVLDSWQKLLILIVTTATIVLSVIYVMNKTSNG